MAQTIADTIAKVQKLLALSKSSNANEAAAAAAQANRLIDKYRLSQADIETDVLNTDPICQDSEYLYETGRVTMWRKRFVHELTKHYGVAYYNDHTYESGRQVSRFRMVGRKSDMEIVRYMYTWLSAECERLAAIEAKGCGRIFVASYQEGFVMGVAKQLQLSREEMKKEATSSAIVKIDSRLDESTKSMYSQVKGLVTTKAKSYRRMNNMAFGMGQQRGQSIHLGAALGTSSSTKLLK